MLCKRSEKVENFSILTSIQLSYREVEEVLVKTSDLRLREVVNTLDGKRLGIIGDMEIDIDSGEIKAIIVPGGNRILGLFGRDEDIVVPWAKVKKIGVDVILVEASGVSEVF
jgi:YlmC/YmxH family sporulation protein